MQIKFENLIIDWEKVHQDTINDIKVFILIGVIILIMVIF